ncbi:MAG TPA: bifunctional diguanylate cyclase/phosphodiesterase [Polyangiaceae bacterium]|nr:bifunctional diguanylate cyclase/phosphodiesterase [Polyangiaceae bacterium]
MLITVAVIFGVELGIMFLFEFVPHLAASSEALVDASLLSLSAVPVLYLAWFRPLTRETAAREKASHVLAERALTDALTGLPNRLGFQEGIRRAIHSASRVNEAFAIVVFDLRRFGDVNGALGQDRGDLVLKLLARRLDGNTGTRGFASRLGSDVFGVLLGGVNLARAREAAERLQELVDASFVVDGVSVEVESQAGFAVFPTHGDDAGRLVQFAEMALQQAKRRGERCGSYHDDDQARTRRRLELVARLRTAIEHGELSLVYQPKVDIESRAFVGVEALVRWSHPELGPVAPSEFVPLAEQTNLVKPLTSWVLEEAVRQMAAWKSTGLLVKVAVNLSARNVADESLPDRVRDVLRHWDVEPGQLTLEVTESAVMADPERAGDVLERLRDLGVKLSIDDFGTGYGSLVYLTTVPASELKIDRRFASNVDTSEASAAVVTAVVGLAHRLGLKVVAEGVESQSALAELGRLGCDQVQGYLVSKPLLGTEILAFATQHAFRMLGVPFKRDVLVLEATQSAPASKPSKAPLRESLRAIRVASAPP